MNADKSISLAVIKRLPRYYRYLGELLNNNITRISSMELSIKMNITASQIRQDLNNFGCFGQQGYGYNVESLLSEIRKILGLEAHYQMVVIGVGNIGQALAHYTNFEEQGYSIIGLFDVSPQIVGTTIGSHTVLHLSQLPEFTKEQSVDIAILSVPSASVSSVTKTAIDNGIKGIWNFSPVDLTAIEGVQIENVHLTDSLMTLSYKLHNA